MIRSNSRNVFRTRAFAADVVTRGEQVGGIETDAQSLRFAHVLHNMREMLKSMTDARTLAGCNLERDFRFHFRNFSKHIVD